ALENPDLRLAFRHLGVFLVTAVPAELALGFVLAYMLREPFRGRGLVRVCLLVPWLLSPIATGVMWHFLFGRAGVLDWNLAWLRPLLLTIALLLIGDTLGTFDSILMMTGGGPGSETLTPALYSFQQAFKAYNWPFAVAASWLIVAAMLLVGLGYITLAGREEDLR